MALLRFQEAATIYIRMTNETKELRSSLLLEQAAYCHLLANPPSVRKYAFFIVLSAYRYIKITQFSSFVNNNNNFYRFSKAGQKRHSSRTYKQGFQACFTVICFVNYLSIILLYSFTRGKGGVCQRTTFCTHLATSIFY